MLSVGFSSRKIIEVVPDSEVISIKTVDTILLQSDAINFTNPTKGEEAIQTFKYTKYGFLEDETFSGIAHIYLYFRVNMEKAKEKGFSNGTSLNMSATLSYGSGSDITTIDMISTYLSTVSLSYYDNSNATVYTISSSPTISEQVATFTSGTFNVSSGATTCYMELTYEFNASAKYSTFEGDVYTPLSSSGISFVLNLSFESV
jgi:hypothetical protein